MKAIIRLLLVVGLCTHLSAQVAKPALEAAPGISTAPDVAVTADLPSGYVPMRPDGRSADEMIKEQNEVKRLRSQGKLQLVVTNADLTDVVRFIADKCEMNYMVMPDTGGSKTPVTINSFGNPWELLNIVADLYNVGFLFKNGVWVFYHLNPNDLFGRTYALRYNTGKNYDGAGGGSGGNTSRTNQTTNANLQNNSSTSTGAMGSGSGGGMGTESTTKVFQVDVSEIEGKIKEFLGLESNGFKVASQGVGTPGSFSTPSNPGPTFAEDKKATAAKGLVTYLKDSNSLYVVATRQQHQWIDQYLADLDKPKTEIELEIKFIETSHEPESNLGIDWSGTFSDVSLGASGLDKMQIDPNHPKNFRLPATAILSAPDLNLHLHALATDSNSTAVQYPRMVTTSGQEVVMRSVVQRPVLQSQASVTSGTATTQNSVQYIDIGTIVNILPERLEGDNIVLNVNMSISTIIGTANIGGNEYPIPSRRAFSYQVIVKSGYSLAVGGLEEAADTTSTNSIPGLGKIPFLGGLFFSSNDHSHSRRNLMMFITPKVLAGYDGGGISSGGASIPKKGLRPVRKSLVDGGAKATADEIKASAIDLRTDILEVVGRSNEGRIIQADLTTLDGARNELSLMDLRLAELARSGVKTDDAGAAVQETRRLLDHSVKSVKEKNKHLPI